MPATCAKFIGKQDTGPVSGHRQAGSIDGPQGPQGPHGPHGVVSPGVSITTGGLIMTGGTTTTGGPAGAIPAPPPDSPARLLQSEYSMRPCRPNVSRTKASESWALNMIRRVRPFSPSLMVVRVSLVRTISAGVNPASVWVLHRSTTTLCAWRGWFRRIVTKIANETSLGLRMGFLVVKRLNQEKNATKCRNLCNTSFKFIINQNLHHIIRGPRSTYLPPKVRKTCQHSL